MLWFNDKELKSIERIEKFKYISCYGSTTYLVMDNLEGVIFKYISCYGSTFGSAWVLLIKE